MTKIDLRFRQIHLDFHTSEHIQGIGAQFDPQEFVATLEKAHVNSITVFARCHHGWMYYDTKVHPERRHPHLARNLLKEQIEACHARGIRAPVYTTIMWDHYTAERHPEWVTLDEHGRQQGTPPYEAGFYRILCVNTPYRDFLKAHIRELLETFDVDGFFLDIVWLVECSCPVCKKMMLERGLEPADKAQRWQFAQETIDEFRRDMSAFIWSINPECGIFYNGGHVGPQHRASVDTFSHWEVESLPSGGWGYLNFPVVARYARTLGLDVLSHTGKFHTAWGDFHSFKNEAALQYECFRMLAQGAKCMIGDQLHPSGQIDAHVYNLIGPVYAEMEVKEPWCQGARPVAEIGVLTPEEFVGGRAMGLPPAMLGLTRMLEEGAQQFDVLDSHGDFEPYKVLILPDAVPVDDALAAKLDVYLKGGGALIASFESGLNADKTAFTLSALGVSLKDAGPRDASGVLVRGRMFTHHDYAEYLLPQGRLAQGLLETEYVMYMKGMEVEAMPGCLILAPKILPYFDRTYHHFCSHRQTPSSGVPGGPAILQKGRCIYFAHPIFTQYNRNSPRWVKRLFLNALALLLPEPLVRHAGPTTLQVSLTEQAAENRWILHALHYIPERRGQDFDVIEDVIPLYNVPFSIHTGRPVQRVVCVPQGQVLDYRRAGERLEFILPELVGHQMVALEF
jgi:hypothetical protein